MGTNDRSDFISMTVLNPKSFAKKTEKQRYSYEPLDDDFEINSDDSPKLRDELKNGLMKISPR